MVNTEWKLIQENKNSYVFELVLNETGLTLKEKLNDKVYYIEFSKIKFSDET